MALRDRYCRESKCQLLGDKAAVTRTSGDVAV